MQKRIVGNYRIFAFALASVLFLVGTVSVLPLNLSAAQQEFPTRIVKAAEPPPRFTATWVRAVSSFRTSLPADQALALALWALRAGGPKQLELAQSEVRKTLTTRPYQSDLWLALALLQSQGDVTDRKMADALKMSFLTSPNDPRLMPLRLSATTRADATADDDLRDLARGDILLMLTKRPELRSAVTAAYRTASVGGKKFLEENVRLIAPDFLPRLVGG